MAGNAGAGEVVIAPARPTQGWSLGAWLTRVLIVLGPQLALWATLPAGSAPAGWLALLTLGVALGWAALPESTLGVVTLGIVLAWWGIGLRDGLTWWALVAAAGLLTAHLAALLASYGPGETPIPAVVAGRWALRGAGLWLLTPVVLGATMVLVRADSPPGVWVAGLAATAAAIVLGLVAYSAATADEDV